MASVREHASRRCSTINRDIGYVAGYLLIGENIGPRDARDVCRYSWIFRWNEISLFFLSSRIRKETNRSKKQRYSSLRMQWEKTHRDVTTNMDLKQQKETDTIKPHADSNRPRGACGCLINAHLPQQTTTIIKRKALEMRSASNENNAKPQAYAPRNALINFMVISLNFSEWNSARKLEWRPIR